MEIFGKWATDNLVCKDLGIAKYVNLKEKVIPHTHGVAKSTAVEKAKVNVVERLINKMMRSGQGKKKLSGKFIRNKLGTGKKERMIKVVDEAFDKIHKITKQNPVQIFIDALSNSAPREDIVRIKRGGIVNNQAVDVAPIKRVDESLKNIALAVFSKTFKTKEEMANALAQEIISASNGDQKSFAVKRRDEIERIAQGSR